MAKFDLQDLKNAIIDGEVTMADVLKTLTEISEIDVELVEDMSESVDAEECHMARLAHKNLCSAAKVFAEIEGK